MANTGNAAEAGIAAGRDIVMADLAEGAFKVVVINGTETMCELYIDPFMLKLNEARFRGGLPEAEKKEILYQLRSRLDELTKTWRETMDQQYKENLEKYGSQSAADRAGFWEFWDFIF